MQSSGLSTLDTGHVYYNETQSNVVPSSGQGNIYVAGHARVHLGDNFGLPQSEDVLRKLLKSLAYPQMRARSQQVASSYPATYEWLLKPDENAFKRWDCFYTWLLRPGGGSLYWIHGKPGSGKSTVAKFIDQNSLVMRHLFSYGRQVVKLTHYFWKGGNTLQKSLEGLCRSLLTQLLNQVPKLASHFLVEIQQMFIDVESIEWDTNTLTSLLLSALKVISDEYTVFMLIDGLDECNDTPDQEILIDIIYQLTPLPNIKLCVTSRPENTFKDAFYQEPQLRLEDLTYADIRLYITKQLLRSPRWPSLTVNEATAAQTLVSRIIDRAQGVFLWVALAMRDIMRGLRDGDTIANLESCLTNLPTDLDAYFYAILQSIQPGYRREACILLQLALFEESEFGSVYTLSLVDTLFVSELATNFVLTPGYNHNELALGDETMCHSMIDVGVRRLNSRCRGLLECNFQPRYLSATRNQAYSEWLGQVLSVNVTFIHRSLRDFLELPHIQGTLFSLTDGPIDARQFLVNARASQMLALANVESETRLSDADEDNETDDYLENLKTGLASHVLSALSVKGQDPITARICEQIKPTIEKLAQNFNTAYCDYWYINDSLEHWNAEGSTFLTLAIDFGLSSYVVDYITTEIIRNKQGRSILSYILKPRFGHHLKFWDSEAGGYTSRSLKITVSAETRLVMLRAALDKGADPNEHNHSNLWPIWSQFLCDTAMRIQNNTREWAAARETQIATIETILALIDAGATPFMPIASLEALNRADWSRLTLDVESFEQRTPFLLFINAWEEALPLDLFLHGDAIGCPMSDLSHFLSKFFGAGLDDVIHKLRLRQDTLQLTQWGTLDRRDGHIIFIPCDDTETTSLDADSITRDNQRLLLSRRQQGTVVIQEHGKRMLQHRDQNS